MEDEWERELDTDESLNVLFVGYDPGRVRVDAMQYAIRSQGFEAELRE